jgi:hypothetical protein
MIVIQLMNGGTADNCGLIPRMLDLDDPRPARDQLDSNYQHGGGWRPQGKFESKGWGRLQYPGDPIMVPLAEIAFRDETIRIYQYGYVAIFQKDGTFEAARMD